MTRTRQEKFPTVFYRPPCVIRWSINPVLARHSISVSPLYDYSHGQKDDNRIIEIVCYIVPKRHGCVRREKMERRAGERTEVLYFTEWLIFCSLIASFRAIKSAMNTSRVQFWTIVFATDPKLLWNYLYSSTFSLQAYLSPRVEIVEL